MAKEITIYRASYRDACSEHQGYEYFSNKRVADKAQGDDNKKRDYDDLDEAKTIQVFDEVRKITFTLSKQGVIDLLNAHGSYPDNG